MVINLSTNVKEVCWLTTHLGQRHRVPLQKRLFLPPPLLGHRKWPASQPLHSTPPARSPARPPPIPAPPYTSSLSSGEATKKAEEMFALKIIIASVVAAPLSVSVSRVRAAIKILPPTTTMLQYHRRLRLLPRFTGVHLISDIATLCWETFIQGIIPIEVEGKILCLLM